MSIITEAYIKPRMFMISLLIDWIKNLKNKKPFLIIGLIIFIIAMVLVPIALTVLPFTYLAL